MTEEGTQLNRKNAQIYISCAYADFRSAESLLQGLKEGGWHLVCAERNAPHFSIATAPIEDCDLVLAFISGDYISDRDSLVLELSYAACALRQPFILTAAEELHGLPPDVEMLAAKDGIIPFEQVEAALSEWASKPITEQPPIKLERRYAYKPFTACEEEYAFVSYAHDDAFRIYPIIEAIYEQGWNLWYDEGIRISERYLPEIARHVRNCEVFLLFVTECSLRRPFVIDFELAYAKKLKKQLIPIMVEDVPFEQSGVLPSELNKRLWGSDMRNYGKRIAKAPKDRQGEEYDISELPKDEDFCFKYKYYGDGIKLEGYWGDSGDVVIPEEYCGFPIRALNADLFESRGRHNKAPISSIVFPESIVRIPKFRLLPSQVQPRIKLRIPGYDLSYSFDQMFFHSYNTGNLTELGLVLISSVFFLIVMSIGIGLLTCNIISDAVSGIIPQIPDKIIQIAWVIICISLCLMSLIPIRAAAKLKPLVICLRNSAAHKEAKRNNHRIRFMRKKAVVMDTDKPEPQGKVKKQINTLWRFLSTCRRLVCSSMSFIKKVSTLIKRLTSIILTRLRLTAPGHCWCSYLRP